MQQKNQGTQTGKYHREETSNGNKETWPHIQTEQALSVDGLDGEKENFSQVTDRGKDGEKEQPSVEL